jgi:hypothetical protein
MRNTLLRLASTILFGLVIVLSGRASAQEGLNLGEGLTLGEVLKRREIPLPPPAIPHLQTVITSYSAIDNENEFVIAYYVHLDSNLLRPPLFVTRLNKRAGKWDHAEITKAEANFFEDQANGMKEDCFGSVLDVKNRGGFYYLSMHWNPSAGCSLILNPDLTVNNTLGGGIGAFFQSGALVLVGNTIHFADTHLLKLFLYQPVTRKLEQFYPPKHDPFREDFSARLSKAVDDEKCRGNNWGCNPLEFSSDVVYRFPIQVNDQTNSLSMRVGFYTEGFMLREEAEDSGNWDDDEYVYIFQFDPFRWREFSVYDVKPKFGTDSLEELITPEKLKQVFATPAP